MTVTERLLSIMCIKAFLFAMLFHSQRRSAQTLDELYRKAVPGRGGQLLRHPGAGQRRENFAGFREALSRHQDQSCGYHVG